MQTLSDFGVPGQPVATHGDASGGADAGIDQGDHSVWSSVRLALVLAVANIRLQRSDPRQV
jgi:hypothetical protein